MPSPSIPKLAEPFRFVNGAAVVREQDSTDEIVDCVARIARTTKGQLLEKPEFGIDDHTFDERGDGVVEDLEDAISEFEPRADFLIEEDRRALVEDLEMTVKVDIKSDMGEEV